ncbi:hypothetical protein FRC17_006260 [Serendipita sp. 399]|nr:hypothetical protein FRC17_006260 [Serendipita sp. 399]
MADAARNSSDTTITTSYSPSVPMDVASPLETSSSTNIGSETSEVGRPEPSETEPIITSKPDEDQDGDIEIGDENTPIDDSTVLSRNGTLPSTDLTTTTERLSPFLAHVTVTSSSVEIADPPSVLVSPDTETSINDPNAPTADEGADSYQQMRSSSSTAVSPESPPKPNTSRPTPNDSQTQNSHASTQQPTTLGDVSIDSLPTPEPVLFTSARTITLGDGVYFVSSFTSTFTTIMPNGATATTSAVYETTISVASAQANNDENIRGIHHPGVSNGPPESEPDQNSSTSFFKRPGAAAGVFIVVFMVLGCIIWMFLLLRRHRRQAATGKKGKQSSYAYGAFGYSPRNRGSYMSYDARNWPERFEEDGRTAASTPPPPPAAEPPEEPRWRPGYVRASLGQDEPQIIAPHSQQVGLLSPRLQHDGALSIPAPIPSTSTSPPIPARSPHRPWSPPVQHTSRAIDMQCPDSGYAGGSTADILPPLLPICRSASTGRRPRMRASSSASISHPYPTSSPTDTGPHPIVLLRRTSDRSRGSPVENPFSSPSYIVPSSSPPSDVREFQERLSNPFADADSPPHSPVDLQYVQERVDPTQEFTLDRGVSLRRTDTLRDKPQRRYSMVTPEPGLMECGSSCGPGSGSEGASSSYASHLVIQSSFKYKPTRYDMPRRSGSLSTAETSVVGLNSEITSPIESELFYNPEAASPDRIANPPFPETAR